MGELRKIQEQINKLKTRINEDLSFKAIKPGEIDLRDISNDEVYALQHASPADKEEILKKMERDIKESMKEGIQIHLSGQLDEKLSPSMGLSAYIDDFVHSKDKRFAGKSKDERINMAKGAFYSAQRNESLEERDEGKPGKNFKKIAAKAAKEYGSKEAGNRVAGAIRKKVLANEADGVEAVEEDTVTMSIPLLLRFLEWAKEDAGEDIQLHKLVEIVEQMGHDGILVSNCYENIIAQITPNDPNINDDGPGRSPETESIY